MIALVPGVSTMEISRRNSLGYALLEDPVSAAPLCRLLGEAQSVMRSVVGVTPSAEISASSKALMNARLARVELADDDQQEQVLEVRVRPLDELGVLGRRAEILQERDETLQKPPLALHQRLSPLVQYPHPLSLPLHASIIDAVGFRDASPTILRVAASRGLL